MKTYFTIFFLLLFIGNIQSQSFDDLIITKSKDSIHCKITLVNDYNIFYDYKKKKNTKSTFISKTEVIEYLSDDYKEDESLINSILYPSCDTCRNWIVIKSGDTLFYNINLNFITKEKFHFADFQIREGNSVSHYTYDAIKSAQWNNTSYFYFNLSNRNIFDSDNNKILEGVHQKGFIGYQKYSGPINVVEFFYQVLQHTDLSTHNKLGYCIVDNSEYIYIPNNRKEFIEVMRKYITKNPKLLKAIENKEFKYKDLETIIKIYNQ